MCSAVDMKFSDMPWGYQSRWIAWTISHDWYKNGARINDDGLLIVTHDNEWLTFKTPRELRDWAGY